jgi:hypothetical protein
MKHPHVKFENTARWKAINAEIANLEENGDMELTTARAYIVGSLCTQLVRKKLIAKVSIVKNGLISN